ncbi:hypothetical protein AB1Y20_016450 [Prymnesium parvum]|uniref:FAD-dependent oxidoreductase domain-containing protein 1 n=1 Tax=Prymnesium parvum TaxID=97485 RepID=A0AB34ID07_PRYPA
MLAWRARTMRGVLPTRAAPPSLTRRLLSSSSHSYDAIIIGAGVIGTSIATELARDGWRTLNIDALHGVGCGSTSYSSGIVRLTYSIAESVKFAWEGYHYWDEWEEHIAVKDERGLAKFRRCGQLIPRSSAAEPFLSRTLACFEQLGLPYEEWPAATVRQRLGFDLRSYAPPRRIDDERFGEHNGSEIEGGVYFPLAGYVSDPTLATHNLQAAALATGRASFAFGARAAAILRTRGGRVAGVRLADGAALSSPVVVNAAGPHSAAVTRLAFPAAEANDMRLSTRPMRQEVAYARAPPGVDWGEGGVGLVVSDPDVGVYWRPEVGGKILCGSLEPPCDVPTHRYVDDPEAVYPGGAESSLTEQWTNQVYRAALRMPSMPLPDAAGTQGVVACYDVTDDWTPIYDGSALPGYYMAIGTSGNQFKNAGIAGRLMREIIKAREGGEDLDAHPLQLPLLRAPGGLSIDTGVFSRLRSAHQTSGSVMG